MITIHEPPIRNSGRIGGKFLERTRVGKPGCPPDKPEFYGPQDFKIGSVIEVFKHRFIIANADHFVLKYMQEHSHQFPEATIESLSQKLMHIAPESSIDPSTGKPTREYEYVICSFKMTDLISNIPQRSSISCLQKSQL